VSGTGETYQCEVCSGVFVKTWSDEEARAEQSATWQPQPGGDGIVCDECYQRLVAWAQAGHPEYLRGGR